MTFWLVVFLIINVNLCSRDEDFTTIYNKIHSQQLFELPKDEEIKSINERLLIRVSFPQDYMIGQVESKENMLLLKLKDNSSFLITKFTENIQSYNMKYAAITKPLYQNEVSNKKLDLLLIWEREIYNFLDTAKSEKDYLVLTIPILEANKFNIEDNDDKYFDKWENSNNNNFNFQNMFSKIKHNFIYYKNTETRIKYYIYKEGFEISKNKINNLENMIKTNTSSNEYLATEKIDHEKLVKSFNKYNSLSRINYLSIDIKSYIKYLKVLHNSKLKLNHIHFVMENLKLINVSNSLTENDIVEIFDKIYQKSLNLDEKISLKIKILSSNHTTNITSIHNNSCIFINHNITNNSNNNYKPNILQTKIKNKPSLSLKDKYINHSLTNNTNSNKRKRTNISPFFKNEKVKYINGSLVVIQTLMLGNKNETIDEMKAKFNNLLSKQK